MNTVIAFLDAVRAMKHNIVLKQKHPKDFLYVLGVCFLDVKHAESNSDTFY